MTLPAFGAERRRLLHGACCRAPAAIDRYLLPDWRSAANPSAAVAAADRCDRRTDGRTDRRQRGTARFAAARRAAAWLQQFIDVSCLPGPQQQTRRLQLLLSIDWTDGQTDGQTDGRTTYRYIKPSSHTSRATSTNS